MLIQPVDAAGQARGPALQVSARLTPLPGGLRVSVPQGSAWPTLESCGWVRIQGRRFFHHATRPHGKRLWVELKNT